MPSRLGRARLRGAPRGQTSSTPRPRSACRPCVRDHPHHATGRSSVATQGNRQGPCGCATAEALAHVAMAGSVTQSWCHVRALMWSSGWVQETGALQHAHRECRNRGRDGHKHHDRKAEKLKHRKPERWRQRQGRRVNSGGDRTTPARATTPARLLRGTVGGG